MQLIETPDNPIPDGAVVETVTTADGVGLRVARFHAATAPTRGVACLLQGRAEFIEKYYETARDLTARGFHVATFDWRGQGGSDRRVRNPRKGHVEDFRQYRLDLDAVLGHLDAVWPGPRFAIAHSMGSCILLHALAERPELFARMVALAPMVALSPKIAPPYAGGAAALLNGLGFGDAFIPGGGATSIATKPFPGNRLTSDPIRYARNAVIAAHAPELAVGDPTIGWLHAAFRAMAPLADPRFARGLRTPILTLNATADPIVDPTAVERFGAYLKTGRAIPIGGARHEILMERDELREQALAAIDAFIPGTGRESGDVARAPQPPVSSADACA